jgi:23S rRNA (uracil1939-C5)-methyltransferase
MNKPAGGKEKEKMTLRLESMAQGGDCLARMDGEAVFVPFGIPGEDVVVEIVSRKPGYARGRIVEVNTPSPHRVEPRCPHYGR